MNKPIVVGMGEALWDVLPDGKKQAVRPLTLHSTPDRLAWIPVW